jgi:hypothetical protein
MIRNPGPAQGVSGPKGRWQGEDIGPKNILRNVSHFPAGIRFI